MIRRQRNKRKLNAEINVVPYIDVTLVLLIIFMVTAPMLTQGVDIELPKAASEPVDTQDNEPLIISVDAEGNSESFGLARGRAGQLLRAQPLGNFQLRQSQSVHHWLPLQRQAQHWRLLQQDLILHLPRFRQ